MKVKIILKRTNFVHFREEEQMTKKMLLPAIYRYLKIQT